MTQFLGNAVNTNYSSYMIEYDNINGVVYISGMTPEGFWEEFSTQDDIAEPESYAYGVHDTYDALGFDVEITEVDYE